MSLATAILLLWSCGQGTDPALVTQREAIAAWREGRVALEAGDAEAAVAAFERARTHRPDDVLLQAWHARALADAGRIDDAIELLRGVTTARPDFAEARYNLAAYLARRGRLEAAGPELHRALADGVADPRDAALDPDFVDHLGHPSLAFLPTPGLEVDVSAPAASVFWGSRAEVTLEIAGARTPVTLDGPFAGPGELVRVVHDVSDARQTLLLAFKVGGEGTLAVGPLTVTSGASTHVVETVEIPCKAPPDKAVTTTTEPRGLVTPAQRYPDALPPAVEVRDGRLLVKLAPTARAEIDPAPQSTPVSWEQRRDGQPEWSVLDYPLTVESTVRVRSAAGVAIERVVRPH